MTNYVKFYRGTPAAYERAEKNNDTLYFISESGSSTGALYLGNILISKSISSLNTLENVMITMVKNRDLLMYNEETEKWINTSITDVIGVMKGASETEAGVMGLVPAPNAGDHNKFLRGDGKWVEVAGGDVDLSNYVTKNEFTNVSDSVTWATL